MAGGKGKRLTPHRIPRPAIRDQPRASIEELNGVATLRLVRAAQRAGVERFLFFSAMGALPHSPSTSLNCICMAATC